MLLVENTPEGKINIIDTESKVVLEDVYVKSITYGNSTGQIVVEEGLTGNMSEGLTFD